MPGGNVCAVCFLSRLSFLADGRALLLLLLGSAVASAGSILYIHRIKHIKMKRS
jgi:hypothetical protein